MLSFLTKVFGSKNERELKRMQPAVDRINALEPAMQAMSDEELRAQTGRFQERVANGRAARRPAAGGVRGRARSLGAHASRCGTSTSS